jgi:phytoene dehydrogenase-like protein
VYVNLLARAHTFRCGWGAFLRAREYAYVCLCVCVCLCACRFADRVFRIVDEYCPGFSSSVLYRDVLSPLDLERIFGLHKGNIQHGSLALHQLAYARPFWCVADAGGARAVPVNGRAMCRRARRGYSSHRMPMNKLYLCGSGAHPGGGVQGAPGRNCASVVLSDL